MTRSDAYRALSALSHVAVAGMDHGWLHEYGNAATAAGLARALAALEKWLELDKTARL